MLLMSDDSDFDHSRKKKKTTKDENTSPMNNIKQKRYTMSRHRYVLKTCNLHKCNQVELSDHLRRRMLLLLLLSVSGGDVVVVVVKKMNE